jgi:hypothetical protein
MKYENGSVKVDLKNHAGLKMGVAMDQILSI